MSLRVNQPAPARQHASREVHGRATSRRPQLCHHIHLALVTQARHPPTLSASWPPASTRCSRVGGGGRPARTRRGLAEGIARIGGPAAQTAAPRLRRAWFSPHTFERAAYLRAVTALDPGNTDSLLTEGLWDCESDVRQFAAEHVPLDDSTRKQLSYLRDDPMETPEVRATAAARLI
ncbi:hypothetical protein [Micromonospora pallida]|uniref:hypothetical protein n=1 Tax=Micromonospora pallida TaxID=145854 RepID=UPI00114CA08F|nr:hypothetical protein [Micromonospora pallida]